MFRIKNLTNSPHKIILAGNKIGRLAARGEDVFDIAAPLVPHYKGLGYFQITDVPKVAPQIILLGSDLLPASIDLGEGRELQLGELVAYAHGVSGLTPEEWNGQASEQREQLLADTIAGLTTKAEGQKEGISEADQLDHAASVPPVVAADAVQAPVVATVATAAPDKTELVAKAKALSIPGVGSHWGIGKLQEAITKAEGQKEEG